MTSLAIAPEGAGILPRTIETPRGYGAPAGGGGYGAPPPAGGGGYGAPAGGGGYGAPPPAGGGGYGAPAGGGGYGAPPPAGYGPAQPGGFTPQPSKGTSLSAVFSFILGLLSAIPPCCCLFAPVGFVGLILGFVGISATGKGKGGRGFAIAGVVLNGLVFLFSSFFFVAGGVSVYQEQQLMSDMTTKVLKAVENGEFSTVRNTYGSLEFNEANSVETLAALRDKMAGWGTLQSVEWNYSAGMPNSNTRTNFNNGVTTKRKSNTFRFMATFDGKPKSGTAKWELTEIDGQGDWLLVSLSL